MNAVTARSIWKYFGDYPALRDISLEVPAGACLALLGRNGAGKTTLLKILGGLTRPSRGQFNVAGKDAREVETRRRIGILSHGIAIYDEFSAFENLCLFARLYDTADAEKEAAEWLERVGLGRLKDGSVREFSRGMRQRLAIARAFLHRPEVLLLDEPFTALDDRAISVLQSLLGEARGAGATVILSTHQLPEALALATHVALLERGRLVYTGERTAAMVEDPAWLYRQYGEA
jgi:heme ABC exporter ATP-binding subunit CcmA